MISLFLLDKVLHNALEEDVGSGDITTISTIPEGTSAFGRYIAKESGILCGIDICERVYQLLDGKFTFTKHFNDGDIINKGDIIAEVSGDARLLLSGERVGLNLMQHLSGIATATNKAVKQIEGTNAVIADTRKTTPGLRTLEKYAVRVGGGSNHRFNLADGVLIKDNHIAAAGSITAAVSNARKYIPHTLKIEVEVEDLDMLKEALDAGADIIIGTGPKVIQKMEWIQSDADDHEAFCAYSLGNSMGTMEYMDNLFGGVLTFEIASENEDFVLTNILFTPTVIHYDKDFSNIALIPLSAHSCLMRAAAASLTCILSPRGKL